MRYAEKNTSKKFPLVDNRKCNVRLAKVLYPYNDINLTMFKSVLYYV